MKKIHLIGIGGSGLSAIARLLFERGYAVSGSDMHASDLTEELSRLGVRVVIGHDPDNLQDADLVIRSSAIPDHNVEFQAAGERGIPVYKRSEFLGHLLEDKCSIAIAGTHGKTTTTSMIAWILSQLELDPSFIIGGVSKDLKTNAHAGKGPHFVIEADEYDNMFLGLNPKYSILTNVDYDHPDCFPSREIYLQAFQKFASKLDKNGTFIACIESENGKAILDNLSQDVKRISYGFSENADYQAAELHLNEHGAFSFQLISRNDETLSVKLRAPGKHNVLNSTAALILVKELGLEMEPVLVALEKFSGTGRRFDQRETPNHITLVDDYAHHPTEIRTTLEAARARFPQQRILAVWQPHTFTRSKMFFDEFLNAFGGADEVIISEVYAARESDPDFSAELFAKNLQHKNTRFIPKIDTIITWLKDELKENDVLIVLSAGSAIRISQEILDHFSNENKES